MDNSNDDGFVSTVAVAPTTKWSIDRSIRLDLIVLLALQLIGGVYYLSNLNTRVQHTEQSLERLVDVPEKLASVQTSIADIKDRLWSTSAQAHTK